MRQKSAVESVLQGKCPQCRKGDLFISGAYNLSKFTKMNEHCTSCNVRYAREPRFFEGAMYFSYVINVGLFLTSAFIIYNFFGQQPVWVYMTSITSAVILLYPLIFRYSRIFYINVFGNLKYDGSMGTDQNN